MFLLPEPRSTIKLPLHMDYGLYCINWGWVLVADTAPTSGASTAAATRAITQVGPGGRGHYSGCARGAMAQVVPGGGHDTG